MLSLRQLHVALLAAVLAQSIAAPAWCDWPHESFVNLQIAPTTTDQLSASVAPDGIGGAYIAFQDFRGANADIYVQRVTSKGVVAPGWPATGLPICTAAGNQASPVAIPDGGGGVIVAWDDARGGPNRDIYSQRVLPAGVVAPGWPANGRRLTTNTQDEFSPVIVTDKARGAFVVWMLDFAPGDYDIYGARVDSTGVLVWSLPIAAPSANQGDPSIAPDGAGGVIVAYDDNAAGNSDVKALRRNASGAGIYGPVTLCSDPAAQFLPSIAGDGLGGAIVAWQDIRLGGNYDIFAIGITPTGTIASGYNPNGNAICTAAVTQFQVQVVSDGNRGAYMAWRDERNFDWDIFMQHVSVAGSIPAGWPVDGIPLCTAPGQQSAPILVPDNLGGVIGMWVDSRSSGGPRGIYATRITPSGALAPGWTSGGTLVTLANFGQYDPRAGVDANGNATFAWIDQRSGSYLNIYAQRVDVFGQLGNPEPSIIKVRDVLADQGGQVRIDWNASYLDVNPTFGVDAYWIWRQAPAAQAQLAASRGGRLVATAELADLARATPEEWSAIVARGLYVRDETEATAFAWEYVAAVEASGFATYSFVASTTTDSTAAHNYRTPFMVQARGISANMFWNSAPDSGYSVDNLPPVAPAPFTGQYSAGAAHLHWGPNGEPDFANYRLYRGSSAGFVPGPGNLIAAPPDTGYTDPTGAGSYYKLSAVDAHGNESAFSLLTPSGTVEVEDGAPPSILFLGRPAPNPTPGDATMHFGLPRAAHVTVAIYDLGGRRVRELQRGALPAGEHVLRWDGRDASGHLIASGLYLVRLESEGRTLTQKLAAAR